MVNKVSEQMYIGKTINFNQRFKKDFLMENNKPEKSNLVKHLMENKRNINKTKENLKILIL